VISHWTLLSWAVSFAEHGITIAGLTALGLAAWLGGLSWTDRRNQQRHQAIQAARDAAPTPAWADPGLADDGDWERLHNVVHQHEHTGTDQRLREQCEAIYRQEEAK
jgi:hypothetical protein